MNIFRKKWGRDAEWSPFESDLLNQLQECKDLTSVRYLIENQKKSIYELFRRKTKSGYSLLAVYSGNVDLFSSTDPFVLATMSNTGCQITVEIKVDGGVIAEIFVKSGQNISDPQKVEPTDFVISGKTIPTSNLKELSGWVLEFFNERILENPSPPITAIHRFKAFFDLPKDYQYLVSMTDGATCGEYEVFGLNIANECTNGVHHLIDLREQGTVCAQFEKLYIDNGEQKIDLSLGFRDVLKYLAKDTLFESI